MLQGIGFALIGLSLIPILLGPEPTLDDYIKRPTFAARQNAKWTMRGLAGQLMSLAGSALLFISWDSWLSRGFVLIAVGVGVWQFRRLRRQRQTWLAKAVAYEDEEVGQTVIPDSPAGL